MSCNACGVRKRQRIGSSRIGELGRLAAGEVVCLGTMEGHRVGGLGALVVEARRCDLCMGAVYSFPVEGV